MPWAHIIMVACLSSLYWARRSSGTDRLLSAERRAQLSVGARGCSLEAWASPGVSRECWICEDH